MSTTIKPLDIYIGGTKVFPDVNTDILAYPVYSDMYEDTQTLNSIHRANMYGTNLFDNYNLNYENMLVLPVMEDTNNSPWHTNDDHQANYWCFFNRYAYQLIHVLEIPFLINQNWLADYFASSGGRLFLESLATSINFDPNTSMPNTVGYDENDHSVKTVDVLYCREMFNNCHSLKEIHGLNLGGQRDHLINTQYFNSFCFSPQINGNERLYEDIKETFSGMFNGCEKLTTLDITWPEPLPGTSNPVLYGNLPAGMFRQCRILSENAIPTFALRPLYTNGTIDISEMFMECNNIESSHITADSWTYIKNASRAWRDTNVHTIDIPASATNLINVNCILGELYWPEEVEGHRDFSGWKYIIRTTAPMIAVLNEVEGADCMLFNFWDYDGNSDFMNTFGGIYVPDAQLQDWKDIITNKYSAPNVAANHVHGLSEL